MRTKRTHDGNRTVAFATTRRRIAAITAVAALATAILFSAQAAPAAPWASHGPVGGNGTAVAIDPTDAATMYAGTNGGGFFKSTDGGASWTAINAGVDDVAWLRIEAIVVDPETPSRVYAAASSGTNGGIYRSTNGGASWTFQSLGSLVEVAISPSSPSTLYAVGGRVYKSTNGGTTWTQVLAGSTYRSVAIHPSNPNVVYVGTIFGSVSKSTDGGTTWTFAGNGIPSDHVDALVVHPANPSILYAGVEDHGLYKTFDGGMTWTSFSPPTEPEPFSVLDIEIDPEDPEVVYVAGYVVGLESDPGVFKTTNGGESWSSTPILEIVLSLSIAASDPSILLAGAQNSIGLWKTTNGAEDWDVSNDGLVHTNVGAIATAPSAPGTVYAATSANGVFRSDDGGASWAPTAFTAFLGQFHSIGVDPTAAGTVYVGSGTDGFYKTIDGGASWAVLGTTNLPILISSIVVRPDAPQTVYAAGFPFVSRSTTGGASWELVPNGMSGFPLVLVMDPSAPSTLWAGTDPANGPFTGVFKSTNGGDLWTAMNVGLPAAAGRAVQAIAVDPTSSATVYASLEGVGIYTSTNGGASWSEANSGLTSYDVRSLAVDPEEPSVVYAATGGHGVFVSTNGGASWAPSNAGLYNRFVQELAVEPGRLYAGTAASGVFVSDTDGLPPQAIRGKSITIQNPVPDDASRRKVTIDASESASSAVVDVDGLLVNGATLVVEAEGAQASAQTYFLPAASWKRAGSTGAVYADKTGSNGPVSSVKLSKSASSVLKLKVKILGKSDITLLVVPPNPGTEAHVRLTVNGGGTYCVGFGGAAGGTVKNTGPFLFRVTNPTASVCS